jgi:hypothetical protein
VLRLLSTGQLYPQDIFMVLISVKMHSAAWRITSMTRLGNEPTAFLLVAQSLNRLRHHLPPTRDSFVYTSDLTTVKKNFD